MYITSYSTIFQISLYCMLCIPLQVVIPCPFLVYHRCLNRVVREHSSFERETINLSLGSEKKREDERKKGDPKSKKKKKKIIIIMPVFYTSVNASPLTVH